MHPAQKIGLIAGQGQLPHMLLARWKHLGLTPVVVGLDGITPSDTLVGHISRIFSIGQAGHILDFLKSEGVTQLVMAGALSRPNFWTLKTDMVGLRIIFKFLFRKVGDDTLLRTLRAEVESRGITVVGVHHYLPELLCPVGVLGSVSPDETDKAVIVSGLKAAKLHGAEDRGQSVVVGADCEVLGYEEVSGTNALIASCSGRQGAVLVKVSKPQQDLALDMPTIGPSTIEAVHHAGFKGIAIEAHKTIVLDQERVISLSNQYGLFLVGIGEDHDI